jgi:hypothetical protein
MSGQTSFKAKWLDNFQAAKLYCQLWPRAAASEAREQTAESLHQCSPVSYILLILILISLYATFECGAAFGSFPSKSVVLVPSARRRGLVEVASQAGENPASAWTLKKVCTSARDDVSECRKGGDFLARSRLTAHSCASRASDLIISTQG